MTDEQRKEWMRRGFQDPVAAYRKHAVGAGKRGIGFHLTFDEWWGLWEAHYERRGRMVGQMCMCRHLDQGDYQIGNVRVDFNRANNQEVGLVHRIKEAPKAYWSKDQYRPTPPAMTEGDWMWRNKAFKEYSEEGLDECF